MGNSSAPEAAGRGYMPQLDSLRWFAVLGVLVAHLWRPRGLPWLMDDLAVEWAGLGVRLFFVLSGFLITGILLDARETAAKASQPRLTVVRQFYVRRVLRIFPIYYLVIICGLVLDLPASRDAWPWMVTYTTNVYITWFQQWPGPFGHFWSLAVEEQFYLVWPWLVLFAPRRVLVPAVLGAIVVAPAYRAWAFLAFPFDIGAMDFKAATLTLASLDTLGAGALLSLIWHSGVDRRALHRVLTFTVLPVGLIAYFGVLTLFHYGIRLRLFFTFADVASALMFVWLVSAGAIGFRGAAGRLLEAPPLIYLGRISYGIYVYHNFSGLLVTPLLVTLGVTPSRLTFEAFLLSTGVTIAIAAISWHAFESPINRMKRRFEYVASGPAPAPAAVAAVSSV